MHAPAFKRTTVSQTNRQTEKERELVTLCPVNCAGPQTNRETDRETDRKRQERERMNE